MSILSLADFSRVAARIFAAGLDSDLWPLALAEMSRASGGTKVSLLGFDQVQGTTLVSVHHGFDPDFLKSFQDYFGTISPWGPTLARQVVGQAVPGEAILPFAELRRTEFYHDWVRPQEDIHAGGGVVLFREVTRTFQLGGNLRAVDSARLQPVWLNLLALCTPILQQAIEINRMLAGQRLATYLLRNGIDTEGTAVAVLGANRKLARIDVLAEHLILAGTVLRLDSGGRLRLTDPALDALVARAATAGRFARATRRQPPSSLGLAPGGYDVRVVPLDDTLLADFSLPSLWYAEPPLSVLLLRPVRPAADPALALRQHLGLSQVEAEIVLALCAGLSPREIALARGTSLHTVRNQIKSAQSRTGAHRQSDLVLRAAHLLPRRT